MLKKRGKGQFGIKELSYYTIVLACSWVLIVGLSLYKKIQHHREESLTLVKHVARSHCEKDILYRKWNALHGGVYVPVSEKSPPNPYLDSLVGERDISTPSGRRLTLVNPAYMIRQVYELAQQRDNVKARLTSLNPLNPGNMADPWEREALLGFKDGKEEFFTIAEQGDEKFFRFIRPFRAESECLSCHAHQGYRLGDIRGAISITVPLAPYSAILRADERTTVTAHVILGLVGMVGLLFGFYNIRKRIGERDKAEQDLFASHENLEQTVARRTADLSQANELLLDEIAEREKVAEKLRLDEERLEALLRLNEKEQLSKDEIVSFGLDETVRLTKSGAGYFYFQTEDPADPESFFSSRDIVDSPFGEDLKSFLELTDIREECIRTGRPVIENLYSNHSPQNGASEENPLGVRHMSVPVFDQDKLIAIVGVVAKQEPYDETDMRQVTLFATGIWKLIQRKQGEEERDQLEKRLRQSQKMEAIGTLAGGIAHDFNNILAVILGYADMAREKVEPKTTIRSELDVVIRAGMQAKGLVRQILEFSRQSEQKFAPIQPHYIVQEVLTLLRHSIPSTIEIRRDIDPQSGSVLGDATQIHQIVMNLCANGYQAMLKSGGVLSVTLRPRQIEESDRRVNGLPLAPGPYVELVVSDTGHGMTHETVEKIFNPYFTTKKIGEGTGLGLSVVHGIVKNHGGHIGVDSEVGRGTTFRVYLPAVVDRENGSEFDSLEPLPGGTERILIVDDEEIIVQIAQRILQSLGYEVTAFTGSAVAWEMLRDHPLDFDLVITDMTMPHMTGMDLAKEYLAIRPDGLVILCTGYSEQADEEKAEAIGVREFVMKPIIKKDFARIVRKVLDGSGREGHEPN